MAGRVRAREKCSVLSGTAVVRMARTGTRVPPGVEVRGPKKSARDREVATALMPTSVREGTPQDSSGSFTKASTLFPSGSLTKAAYAL